MQTQDDREANIRRLAHQLMFAVKKKGERFTLTRTADVSQAVCEKNLTLEQAEQLLRTWKMRGFHGG